MPVAVDRFTLKLEKTRLSISHSGWRPDPVLLMVILIRNFDNAMGCFVHMDNDRLGWHYFVF